MSRRPFSQAVFPLMLATCVCLTIGCHSETPSGDSHATHDHDEHHDDGHVDHDHDGDGIPDHGPGEHADDMINPSELGLNVDDLPSSGEASKPETFEAAVAQVGDLVEVIQAGLIKGDANSVHMELHDIGDALYCAEDLAKETQQDKAVLAAIDSLFDAFGAIDETLHGKEGKEYSEVEDDINSAMKTLQDAQGK